ncbi:hypothetical protein E2C01_029100 [Portunus trituberculatus]|uniref:MULE transposase domain-containing protein n=1 Tax=Portunus trituberculatus TaxID=210409 RepID=A0A5B7EM74_PORTR|nr:hypothetical protein [Portunus trituberculatus]
MEPCEFCSFTNVPMDRDSYPDEPAAPTVEEGSYTDEPAPPIVEEGSYTDKPAAPTVEEGSYTDEPATPAVEEELESSIEDPSIQDTEPQAEGEVAFQIIEKGTKRGKDKLIDNLGYTYNKKMQRSHVTYWQCTVHPKHNPCQIVITQRNGDFVKNKLIHNHLSPIGSAIATRVSLEVKELAVKDLFKSASAIVDDVLLQEMGNSPCQSLPKPDHLARTVNRQRQKLRPTEPKDLQFELDAAHIPADFLRADVTVHERRHLIFATTQQINYLIKAKSWYLDGTFKLCRYPFMQLLTINAFVRADDHAKQVPLMFALMSGRKKSDYRKVFQELLTILPAGPSVQHITVDYEKAIWKVLPEFLPDTQIKGCVFHWTQAIWRKIQEVGLQHGYTHNDGTYKYLCRVMALPFLPEEEIIPIYDCLSRQATTAQLQSITDYISRTWIHSSTWPPSSWSVFNQSIRTYNDIEGWHNRFNKRAVGRCNLQLYLLVNLLHKEAKITFVHIRLVAEKKIVKNPEKKI